jgi:hypothetical protein
VIGRLWLLGHWTTKKIIGSQKFDLKIFSVSTVSLRILNIRIYTFPLIFLDFVVFPDLPFQCKSTQTTKLVAMSERASERAALVSSSVVAAGLVVVFRFRRFRDRLSSAASDDEEEETRNF